MTNPLVLSFDTSAAHVAAALLCGDEIIARKVEEMKRGQAERLVPLLEEVLAADERVLKDPAPTIVVGELADSSVNFLCRPWVKSGDYWPVLWDTTETVKRRFDESGIGIPFPQMDVHLDKSE